MTDRSTVDVTAAMRVRAATSVRQPVARSKELEADAKIGRVTPMAAIVASVAAWGFGGVRESRVI